MQIGRREFSKTIGLWILSLCLPAGCGNRSMRFDPQVILNDLRNNEALLKMRDGTLDLNYHELFSEKGRGALTIIQRGLISLELMVKIPEHEYGRYGDKTTVGIFYLQNWAGIDMAQGLNGRRIEAATLEALEEALQEKIDGRWDPQEIKRRIPIPENLALSPTPRGSSRRSLLLSIFRGQPVPS